MILKDLDKICKLSLKIFEDPQRSWQENVGEFDLNTLRVDGKFLNTERKSCGFKNIRIREDGARVQVRLSNGLRSIY